MHARARGCCWRRRRGRRRSAGRQGRREQSGAEQGSGGRDSPSSRRKPWRRRVALLRMHGTKQRDFTDELTSTNVDPRRSSASGTTLLRRYFIFFFHPQQTPFSRRSCLTNCMAFKKRAEGRSICWNSSLNSESHQVKVFGGAGGVDGGLFAHVATVEKLAKS